MYSGLGSQIIIHTSISTSTLSWTYAAKESDFDVLCTVYKMCIKDLGGLKPEEVLLAVDSMDNKALSGCRMNPSTSYLRCSEYLQPQSRIHYCVQHESVPRTPTSTLDRRTRILR